MGLKPGEHEAGTDPRGAVNRISLPRANEDTDMSARAKNEAEFVRREAPPINAVGLTG